VCVDLKERKEKRKREREREREIEIEREEERERKRERGRDLNKFNRAEVMTSIKLGFVAHRKFNSIFNLIHRLYEKYNF